MSLPVLLYLLFALGLVLAVAAVACVLVTRRIAAEAERLVPPVGRFIEAGGNRIHYVDEGEGRPILFVHGLGGQLHHFRHTLFGRFGPGYRLVALDRPGSGYSTRIRGASGRLPEQAEMLAAFIDALGLERPLVVGHSLGGAIALTLAVEHPQKISGLALLSPLTKSGTYMRRALSSMSFSWPPLRWVVAQTIAMPLSRRHAARVLNLIFGPQPVPDDYGTAGGGWSGLRPSHFYATSTDMAAVEKDLGRIEARYGEIAVPVGILFGSADRILKAAQHGEPMKEKIAGLDYERIKGLGHMPQFVEPERVTSFIERVAERAFAPVGAPEGSDGLSRVPR